MHSTFLFRGATAHCLDGSYTDIDYDSKIISIPFASPASGIKGSSILFAKKDSALLEFYDVSGTVFFIKSPRTNKIYMAVMENKTVMWRLFRVDIATETIYADEITRDWKFEFSF